MKVFLSWSGNVSQAIAETLSEWLPAVIQCVEPYFSPEDIQKGTRWSSSVAKELDASSFGIICVTPDNTNAQWIHFEAGALSKKLDSSKVCPLLFKLKPSEVQGPLAQFQLTACEKDDVFKLLKSINASTPEEVRLDDNRLKKAFERWWPDLENKLSQMPPVKTPVEPRLSEGPILEEMLELLRAQQRILNSPDKLMPIDYLQKVLGSGGLSRRFDIARAKCLAAAQRLTQRQQAYATYTAAVANLPNPPPEAQAKLFQLKAEVEAAHRALACTEAELASDLP